MKHYFTTVVFIISLLSCISAFATRGIPGFVKLRQPDGSLVQARICGDEHLHYIKLKNGYLAAFGGDGYLYYANFDSGKLHITSSRISENPGNVEGSATSVPSAVLYNAESARRALNSFARNSFTGESLVKTVMYGASPEIRSIVISVEFSDVKFTTADVEDKIYRYLNEKGYSDDGASGSLSDYLYDNFGGRCSFVFDVAPKVSLDHPEAYYEEASGDAGDNTLALLKDACSAAVSEGVDFSNYDCNGDGFADNVEIIFAGYNSAEGGGSGTIWPQYCDISSKHINFGGVYIAGYTCTSELSGNEGGNFASIGMICHEFSHALGLPDMYDTNYETGGESNGLWGSLSVMDEGNFLNGGRTPPYYTSIEREILGIYEEEILKADTSYFLPEISCADKIFRLPSTVNNEYFLLECRCATGWDSYIGGSGMVVYHVDKSLNVYGGMTSLSRWNYNNINAYSEHPCACVVCASGDVSAEDLSCLFYPGASGNTSLDDKSKPILEDWKERFLGVGIENIYFSGKDISFNTAATSFYDASLPGASDFSAEIYQREAVISWRASYPDGAGDVPDGTWTVSYKTDAEAEDAYKTVTGLCNTVLDIKNLLPGTKYDVKVRYAAGKGSGDYSSYVFSTGDVSSEYPYIYVESTYTSGKEVRLRLLNIPDDAKKIVWKINGYSVNSDIYRFKNCGAQKIEAYIEYSDGSEEILQKDIIVN
ncbi:MAG: M6 family metalloprotease domain-containing protein [Bacteroidales bacterium]|jgi:M6 family metalloprotease-like protein|nr:M6 family metalloprotease domain-containing protein [Bacteroidales bacterium]